MQAVPAERLQKGDHSAPNRIKERPTHGVESHGDKKRSLTREMQASPEAPPNRRCRNALRNPSTKKNNPHGGRVPKPQEGVYLYDVFNANTSNVDVRGEPLVSLGEKERIACLIRTWSAHSAKGAYRRFPIPPIPRGFAFTSTLDQRSPKGTGVGRGPSRHKTWGLAESPIVSPNVPRRILLSGPPEAASFVLSRYPKYEFLDVGRGNHHVARPRGLRAMNVCCVHFVADVLAGIHESLWRGARERLGYVSGVLCSDERMGGPLSSSSASAGTEDSRTSRQRVRALPAGTQETNLKTCSRFSSSAGDRARLVDRARSCAAVL